MTQRNDDDAIIYYESDGLREKRNTWPHDARPASRKKLFDLRYVLAFAADADKMRPIPPRAGQALF